MLQYAMLLQFSMFTGKIPRENYPDLSLKWKELGQHENFKRRVCGLTDFNTTTVQQQKGKGNINSMD